MNIKIMNIKIKLLIYTLLIPFVSVNATDSASIKVSANTLSGCTIEFSDINLGTFSGAESVANTIRPVALNVHCTKGTPYTIKTPNPKALLNPDNQSSVLGYTYGIYNVKDRDENEFIGYRFKNIQSEYANTTSTLWFGTGLATERGTKTAYIVGVGKGALEKINFDIEYYKYKRGMKAGDYAATHTFNLDY